jgi:hypothetical protein
MALEVFPMAVGPKIVTSKGFSPCRSASDVDDVNDSEAMGWDQNWSR